MNNTMNDSEGFQFRPAHLVIAILVITWMIFVIRKYYGRHKDNLEPIHILQIHFQIEFLLVTFSNIFIRTYGIEKIFSKNGSEVYCFLVNFLNHYTELSMMCSCSIFHYEKYQLLKFNYSS